MEEKAAGNSAVSEIFKNIFQFSSMEGTARRRFYVLSYDCIDIFQTAICVGVFLEKEYEIN